jgi:osmotically-inducible protein OsmY
MYTSRKTVAGLAALVVVVSACKGSASNEAPAPPPGITSPTDATKPADPGSPPANPAGPRPPAAPPSASDAALNEAVRGALVKAGFDASKLRIESRGGSVVVRGTVKTPEQEMQSESVVGSVPGVRLFAGCLIVEGQPPLPCSNGSGVPDDQLPPDVVSQVQQAQESLRRATAIERDLEAAHVAIDDLRVAMTGDTVVLTGTAKTAAMKQRAGELAARAPDVKVVHNEIRIVSAR